MGWEDIKRVEWDECEGWGKRRRGSAMIVVVLLCETVQWRREVERKRQRVGELFYLLYKDARCPVSPPVPHGLATVSAVLLLRPIYPVERREWGDFPTCPVHIYANSPNGHVHL